MSKPKLTQITATTTATVMTNSSGCRVEDSGEGDGFGDEIGMAGSEILNGVITGYLSTASTM